MSHFGVPQNHNGSSRAFIDNQIAILIQAISAFCRNGVIINKIIASNELALELFVCEIDARIEDGHNDTLSLRDSMRISQTNS